MESQKKWLEKRKHKCFDCDRLVDYRSKRCGHCNTAWQWRIGIARKVKGASSPNWRGGKHKTGAGYIRVYKPEHPHVPNDRYVLEHRLIMEDTLGRYLKPGEVVHHLNGIKHDNRPENLVVTSNKKHPKRSFMQMLQQRIRDLEQLHFFPS